MNPVVEIERVRETARLGGSQHRLGTNLPVRERLLRPVRDANDLVGDGPFLRQEHAVRYRSRGRNHCD